MAKTSVAEELIQHLRCSAEWRGRLVHVERYAAREPQFESLPLPPALLLLLRHKGIHKLYTHQAQAIRAIRDGVHVAITTPTASGKSFIYLLSLWERRLEGDDAHALYLAPLKALAQDQRRLVEELGAHLPATARLSAALYDGDTPSAARTRIRSAPPALVLSNPDMVHRSVLAFHSAWAGFLSKLRYVILDEAHTYRGVFGSHVSGILRRLKRVCAHYGATPQFIVTSATLCNPDEFLRRLTGETFTVIADSGAPAAPRFFALIKPRANAYTETCELMECVLRAGLKTITFTKARKITELLSLWLAERAPDLAGQVKAYRAGYLPEERRALERALTRDELSGIITTSALELGIDIGGLDACLLVGFPGTMLSTWQRAGRVGRGSKAALIALIGMEDALDLYYLAHPLEFFNQPPERLLLDEANPAILKAHLVCAAAELPLVPTDEAFFGPSLLPRVEELKASGRLLEAAAERRWFTSLKSPQRHVNIRSVGESFLIEEEDGKALGTVDGFRVFKECHPRAIYLHAGSTFETTHLNQDARRVTVRAVTVDYYTQAITNEETTVLRQLGEREFEPGRLAWGEVRVTSRVVGYERKLVRGGGTLSEHALSLPPQEFETQAVWLVVPYALQQVVKTPGRSLQGALHALEHVSIALFPLFALCDRWDLGGISTPHHPHTGTASIFIYDGVPGGVGLARHAYDIYLELLTKVAAHLAACPCEAGCPSCIHSPKCGSRNAPLDKAGALALAHAFTSTAQPTAHDAPSPFIPGSGTRPADDLPPHPNPHQPLGPRSLAKPRSSALKGVRPSVASRPLTPPSGGEGIRERGEGHTVIFDLETQKLAEEVGGWDHKREMRMSVGVIYDLESGSFREYLEHEAQALYDELRRARLIVGFNVKSFDYEVLSAYVPRADLDRLPTLDLLEHVHAILKRRVRLDDLARATLGKGKLADGVEAVRLFREHNLAKLIEYCRHDVLVTKELYEFGVTNGYVLFPSVQGTMKLPAGW